MAVASWCGAAKQKATIDTQIAAIRATISATGRRGTAQAADLTGPKRRTISAARPKTVSRRMKAYWATTEGQSCEAQARAQDRSSKENPQADESLLGQEEGECCEMTEWWDERSSTTGVFRS